MKQRHIQDLKNSNTFKYTLNKKYMKTEAENIMDGLCVFLSESTLDMIISVEEEMYEEAQHIKDNIEDKISKVIDLLIRKEWTKLTEDQLEAQLHILKEGYIKRWYDVVPVPRERIINNI